ncbi:hypothetical protein JXA31_08950 [Candidatus Bathyarchaeota archaeon]|nr:hypothetical protein [Candidatus Bathyarchaeota archaeon]
MSDISKLGNKTKLIAFIAIFAALFAVLRRIPTVPMVGVAGAYFSLSDVAAPIYGAILGPFTGGLSVVLGTFLAVALGRASPFLGLDFLPAAVNVIAIGLLFKRKWGVVVILNAVLLFTFLLHPFTSILVDIPIGETTFSFPFAWLHIVAFVVLISPLGRKAAQWVSTLETHNIAKGIAVLAFVGTMMQHLMGNLLYEIIFGQVLQYYSQVDFATVVWPSVFFLYPVERFALVIFAVVVGTPLVRILKKSLFADSNSKLPDPVKNSTVAP